MDEKFEALRRRWYGDMRILFNIIQCLKYRETTFIRVKTENKKGVAHRCLKCNMMSYLQKNMERYKFLDEPMNLYGSLAHYPDMPMFSFGRQAKRAEMDEFNKKHLEYATGYDFCIDLDGEVGKMGEVIAQLKKILPYFKDMPYYTIFTGKKGVHLRIDHEDMSEDLKKMPIDQLADYFKRFTTNFKHINGFNLIDDSIYDTRRVAKCPYSVVYPFYFIALPMTDQQIENYDIKEYSIKSWLNRMGELRNRGLLKRKGDPKNFDKLLKKYGELS